jgi:PTH1 family peptidyl-tRNA hydrolase
LIRSLTSSGHNGIKSLDHKLGNTSYAKLLLGIGRPVSRDPEVVAKYVLGKFREEEILELKEVIFPKAEELLLKELFKKS